MTMHPGDQQTHTFVVAPADLVDFGPARGGAIHPVLSTYALGRELEWAGRLFALALCGPGQEGIGTALSLEHLAPAFLGETVTVTATFEDLDAAGRLRCAVEARVGSRLVARGHTGQRLVSREKLAARFAQLREQA